MQEDVVPSWIRFLFMDVFDAAQHFLVYLRPVVVHSRADTVLYCQICGDPMPI